MALTVERQDCDPDPSLQLPGPWGHGNLTTQADALQLAM